MADLLDAAGRFVKKDTRDVAKASRNGTLDKDDRFWLTTDEVRLLHNGLTPVEYLFEVMRDNFIDTDTRMRAATVLLPYIQAKAPTAINVGTFDKASEREANAVRDKLKLLLNVVDISEAMT